VIEGDRATLELRQGYRLIVHREGAHEEIDVEPAAPAWAERPWHVIQESVAATQAHFLECLRTGAEPRPSGRDNLQTLALALASYESADRDSAVDRQGRLRFWAH
jgi:predicted dehydrogenase